MEKTIALAFTEFSDDLTFQLVAQIVRCDTCGEVCTCEGYDGANLVYCCPRCHSILLDKLDIEPLFACDPIDAATRRHYKIACPYCGGQAVFVGGSSRTGLFFVCEHRCHHHFARYVRRF